MARQPALTAIQLVQRGCPNGPDAPAAARKLRLVLCGLLRAGWDEPLHAAVSQAVEVAEGYADGRATAADRQAARQQLDRATWLGQGVRLQMGGVRLLLAMAACAADEYLAYGCLSPEFCDHTRAMLVARDLFPERSVKVPKRWRPATVTALARGAYDDRAFDRLPVLADALDDAGCDHAKLLAHLRGPGPHVRGCWALDAVLGLG